MNFLILGDGIEERAWAETLAGHPVHRLRAVFPGVQEGAGPRGEAGGGEDVPQVSRDLDEALATAGVDAAIVGGDPELRAEGLRRAAAAGWPVICLHPPGPDSEAYYQVALSRAETGAVIVPDLPLRRHPGVERLRLALEREELGAFRSLRLESPGAGDLVRFAFPRVVDAARALLGEIEAVTATGSPPGEHPADDLVVHLRGPGARRGEIRLWNAPGAGEPARLVLAGSDGTLTLELDPSFQGPSRLIRRSAAGDETVTELEPWDPHAAVLETLDAAVAGREAHPDLLDGTRALELAEAVVRSLRRGRTIELHYEEISEDGTFKSVMTSLGCAVLLGILLALPVALVGPAIGIPGTLSIAYLIPPVLIAFIVLQVLRLGLRRPKDGPSRVGEEGKGEPNDPFSMP